VDLYVLFVVYRRLSQEAVMKGQMSWEDMLLWKLTRAITHGQETEAYYLTRMLCGACPRR